MGSTLGAHFSSVHFLYILIPIYIYVYLYICCWHQLGSNILCSILLISIFVHTYEYVLVFAICLCIWLSANSTTRRAYCIHICRICMYVCVYVCCCFLAFYLNLLYLVNNLKKIIYFSKQCNLLQFCRSFFHSVCRRLITVFCSFFLYCNIRRFRCRRA